MKIAYLGAGAAGRYCGACLHDNTLATALQTLGEDILLIPTYTPIRTDEDNVSQSRVFFGGVNVYLQQHSALFRHTPWFLDRMLDSPSLLDWLSKRSSGMEAKQFGALTVSTLQGEHGRQRKEIAKLVRWLKQELKPDVVHISNVLLSGVVPQIRKQLQVPIVASLAGEDIFIEQLTEPHYSKARRLLKESAQHIDRFVAMNHYYADFMVDYLTIPRDKITVIRHGLKLAGHGTRAPRATSQSTASQAGSPNTISSPRTGKASGTRAVTIGYFARVAVEKGLHLLIEAFALLCEDKTLPLLQLRVAGYKSAGDEPYFQAIVERVRSAGLTDRFEYAGELDRAGKIAFLQSIDLMALPTVYRESKGISVIEALANAVPVVLPSHGTFPELIEETGGGLLCEPENPRSLADAIAQLIRNPQLADQLGLRGQQAIRNLYTAEQMAVEHRELYRKVCEVEV